MEVLFISLCAAVGETSQRLWAGRVSGGDDEKAEERWNSMTY